MVIQHMYTYKYKSKFNGIMINVNIMDVLNI